MMPPFLTSFGSLLRGRVLLAYVVLLCAGCATQPKSSVADQATPAGLFLKKAAKPRTPASQSAAFALSAAEKALAMATDKTASAESRAQGLRLYNAAVAECVAALQEQGFFKGARSGVEVQGADAAYRLRVVPSGESSLKNPATFTRLVDSKKIYRKHLKSNTERPGLGAPLVGVSEGPLKDDPQRPVQGFAEPLTAVAAFGPSRGGVRTVDLFFFDPRKKDTIVANGTKLPLEGDFTAPLAYFPRKREMLFGIVAMLRSDLTFKRSAIYFVEPYDPDKIPILFVHGLMSSPHAWIEFVNELNASPEFRRRYQPWVYFYPSGGPIAGNALRLREDLEKLAAQYPLKRKIILVGHSMGGIISKMQVVNTRDRLWNSIFGAKAEIVSKMLPETSLLKRALIFEANPHVSRVIFFATPHLGSRLATLRISALAGSLIRMPAALIRRYTPEMNIVRRDVDPQLRAAPNSIIGLSPKSPLLKGMAKLPINTPYHSIIGNRGRDSEPLAKTSDGIVPYWSSHLEGARSEIIVPTGHDAFDCPASVTEMLRILAIKE